MAIYGSIVVALTGDQRAFSMNVPVITEGTHRSGIQASCGP
jgi:hypothetical protein